MCPVCTSIAFTKKLGLRLTNILLDAYQINHCTSQKLTLKSPLVDFKQECEWWASHRSLLEIKLQGHEIRGHSFICTLQCDLLPFDTICDSAVFHMISYDRSRRAHDLYTARDSYANNTVAICTDSL